MFARLPRQPVPAQPVEVPGLAYYAEPATVPAAPAARKEDARLAALTQMFAYYDAE